MIKSEKKGNKVVTVFALIIIFIIVSCAGIFGVNVSANYVKNGKLTYDVAPVSTVLDIIQRFSDKKSDNEKDAASQENGTENNSDEKSLNNNDDGENTLVNLVDNVMPSIVAIDCTVEVQLSDVYSYFYGKGGSTTSKSSGSGIIIAQNSQEILIATNNHVVEDAAEVTVTFNDKTQCKATVKGTDASSDLAVLSVLGKDISNDTVKNIRIATLGDSKEIKVGDTAIAIGNSMGYGQSVTKGVVSALDRTLASSDYSMELIQTDAAINPGNSGGALLNSRGEVIGINSIKYVSNTTESIGYAIPIADAVPIINELINYEEIDEDELAYMGIEYYTVSDTMASYFNCSKGAYIKSVEEDSPAEEAGLLAGDIIVGFDKRKISSVDDVEAIIKLKRGGANAEIVYERLEEGKYVEHTTTITFGNKGDYDK